MDNVGTQFLRVIVGLMRTMKYPAIIQGGMGVAVSGWPLARAVSILGQLGVVSATALDVVLARKLQNGDQDGHLRRAISSFPVENIGRQVLEDYFSPHGKPPGDPFRSVPLLGMDSPRSRVALIVLANYVEVFLAKEGHSGVVGVNLMEKIQLPTLPALYGAMLAGVDYVLMGAGIPRSIPQCLDRLAAGGDVTLKLDVSGAEKGEDFASHFSPAEFCGGAAPALKRPLFLPIVSSATLAITLAKKSNGVVDGFVVEEASAGGHNAPPRGQMQLNAKGEPVYGSRDIPEIEKIRELGLPFWLAGAYGSPERLAEAKRLGAKGVQLGTPFAYCRESGMTDELKNQVVRESCKAAVNIFTDPKASPTGFPFKVVQLEGSVSEEAVRHSRKPVCDLGVLRRAYRRDDGSVGFRCPSEPRDAFLRKGGAPGESDGRTCICNGLLATIGLGQSQPGAGSEPPLLTAGEGVNELGRFLTQGEASYSAADVLRHMLS
ncbi:NAD(P)H-dependent flavin oxidoreductase YrpB, nitropropane dioxygenase family [Terrimicrobium sacchariphilum]|uniref:NAD(P)H-dependent flavin oxidoreductase YrpB, nitropropane dioxygenase family n=1 Tax=Terrimicrobium sacchariphilum TaxID=690879 RepID=A0A146G9T4_TERSA|nr:nitronate monooxygenase [Terrimicrobium sacchariphilum]GAT34033.1 NAD(P)H-dependent flavin oxidoreductase YrpB, nitropropane dioxygenase family [Terrimicrobium sacchariphilum]